MIPFAYVSGQFFDALGVARANQQVTFVPLSTPYAIDGEIVLSIPQILTLDGSGRLFSGADLFVKFAKGFYRVIAADNDAFTISVGDDGLVHTLSSLSSNVNGSPSTLNRVLTTREIAVSTIDSPSVTRTRRGVNYASLRFMFLGEPGDLTTVDSTDVFPAIFTTHSIDTVCVLGNVNPGGLESTFDDAIAPFSAFTPPSEFVYALGSEDWTTGDPSYIRTELGVSNNYYRVQYMIASGIYISIFVLSSNALEPTGNTSSGDQATWLRSQLASSTDRWNLVMFADTPVSSVAGAATPAMLWPFAEWGADAVIASGAEVCEGITLTGGIPLFVIGNSGVPPYDTFGAPVSGQFWASATFRSVLKLVANEHELLFQVVDTTSAHVLQSFTFPAAEDKLLAFEVVANRGSGLKKSNGVLELDAVALAYLIDQRVATMLGGLRQQEGPVVRRNIVPTPTEARQDPRLKNSLVAVGDDPSTFYWWNNASSTFEEFVPSASSSLYSGSRTQLVVPTIAPSGNHPAVSRVAMVSIAHTDPDAEIWVSENGGEFTALSEAYPVYYYKMTGLRDAQVFLSAFARKTGFLDSEIVNHAYICA